MAKLRNVLLLVCWLMACAGQAHADGPTPVEWRVVHLGTPSQAFQFVDPLHGWGLNGARQLLRTTDGGQTWSITRSDTLPYLYWSERPYVFVTPLLGWAIHTYTCGAGWAVDVTTDGGQTWREQQVFMSNHCGGTWTNVLEFVDARHGWVDGSAGAFQTTDGGQTWAPWTTKPAGGANLKLKLVSRSVWHWLRQEPSQRWRLYKTTDGGATTTAGGLLPDWTATAPALPDVASDTNTLVVAGAGGKMARSTDFGLTWQDVDGRLVSDAGMPRFADDDHGWVFAGTTLVHTADGGRTWAAQEADNTDTITSLTVVDPTHAFFLAERLHGTSDGGASWEALPYASAAEVTDLATTPREKVYAAGSLLGSSDGGQSWREYAVPGTRIATAGEDHVWSLNGSTLYGSADAGQTWRSIALPVEMQAVDFADGDHGWGISWQAIYQSSDGGATWNKYTPSADCQCQGAGFKDVTFTDATNGWVLGLRGSGSGASYWFLLRTTNGGATWERLPDQLVGGSDLVTLVFQGRLRFAGATEGWLVGCSTEAGSTPDWGPLLYHTTDGGQTWRWSLSPDADYGGACLNDIDFAGARGWAVGSRGLLLHSTDGGATWRQLASPAGSLLSVKALRPGTVYAGSVGGLIVRLDEPVTLSRRYLPVLAR